MDVSDVIAELLHIFYGGAASACEDAADPNDDGRLDIADPIFLLGHLFSSSAGTVIPAPGPLECGLDPRPDGLGCDSSPCRVASPGS